MKLMSIPEWGRGYDWKLIETVSLRHGLDSDLVAAVIQTESSGNTYAMRYEPNWGKYTFNIPQFALMLGCTRETMSVMQKCSWGLMQVMGGVAYEHGLDKMPTLEERWPSALLNPIIGIEFGCRVLASHFKRWGPMVENVVAGYNWGHPRKRETGEFLNQQHVDRFLSFYHELKGVDDGN